MASGIFLLISNRFLGWLLGNLEQLNCLRGMKWSNSDMGMGWKGWSTKDRLLLVGLNVERREGMGGCFSCLARGTSNSKQILHHVNYTVSISQFSRPSDKSWAGKPRKAVGAEHSHQLNHNRSRSRTFTSHSPFLLTALHPFTCSCPSLLLPESLLFNARMA